MAKISLKPKVGKAPVAAPKGTARLSRAQIMENPRLRHHYVMGYIRGMQKALMQKRMAAMGQGQMGPGPIMG